MKISLWFIILTIFIGFSVQAQKVNKKIIDPKHEKEILIGHCTSSALQEGEYGKIYEEEYKNYVPDEQFIKQLSNVEGNIDIVLVLATWCHDSEVQVPRFYRIMDEANLADDVITVICVDGNKTAGELNIDHLKIELVPTFIFYRGGEEIGRIVETPETSIEEDMWGIVSGL